MAVNPTIGEMKDVLKWERVNKASDTTGGQNEQYVDWFICRGKVKEMSNARKFNSGYDETVSVWQCWIPWRSEFEAGVTKDTRVVYDNHILSVETYKLVNEKRRMYYIELKEAK